MGEREMRKLKEEGREFMVRIDFNEKERMLKEIYKEVKKLKSLNEEEF